MAHLENSLLVDSEASESSSSSRRLYCGYWGAEEMDDYFKNVQASSQIPVFPLNGGDFESPMNVLVPPRMESLFLDHREGLGVTSPLPHALLVRDWPVAGALEYQSWWLNYFSEEEVEEAAKKRKADVDGRVPNQLEEHAELCSVAPVARAFRFRECDLGDSFERGRSCQRSFDVWLWKSFYQNPHMFPTLGCLINMVRIKQLLWNRYGFFFDVDTIQEVYPEQELAEWVIKCYHSNDIATPIYRDEEMSYECRNSFFANPWPRRIRSYSAEMAIQRRRQRFRESRVEFEHGGVNWFDSRLRRRVFEGEVLPDCLVAADKQQLAERQSWWERRRDPSKSQHDAEEPNPERWSAKLEEEQAATEVSPSPLAFSWCMLFLLLSTVGRKCCECFSSAEIASRVLRLLLEC